MYCDGFPPVCNACRNLEYLTHANSLSLSQRSNSCWQLLCQNLIHLLLYGNLTKKNYCRTSIECVSRADQHFMQIPTWAESQHWKRSPVSDGSPGKRKPTLPILLPLLYLGKESFNNAVMTLQCCHESREYTSWKLFRPRIRTISKVQPGLGCCTPHQGHVFAHCLINRWKDLHTNDLHPHPPNLSLFHCKRRALQLVLAHRCRSESR